MTHALTRAGTIGPVAEFVEASGGSVARLFRDVDLPAELLDRPHDLILLRDHFRLVETAARLIGDDALPLRLSMAAGLDGLGIYGQHITSFPDLSSAILQGYDSFAHKLQSSTEMELFIDNGIALWTYHIDAPLTVGRQKNELLALGYMLSLLRWFLGSNWSPSYILLPDNLVGRRLNEDLVACSIESGPIAGVAFPAELLDHPAPLLKRGYGSLFESVPSDEDIVAIARHMIALERLAGRHGIVPVARRMGMTKRTLQRRFAERGTTFAAVRQLADRADAIALLERGNLSITEVADCIGYSDPAHFTRAFRQWTGLQPSRWQRGGRGT